MCGFSRPVGKTEAHPKLQQLVTKLKKRQQEEAEVNAKAEGTHWEAEVKLAKKRVQAARREVEDEHGRIYRTVVAKHERHMERAVPYKSLRYIRELAEGGRPQDMTAVRLPDGRVTSNNREVLAAVGESFRKLHNKGQWGLGETTRKMVRALLRVFMKEQSEAIRHRRVILGEMAGALQALRDKKSPVWISRWRRSGITSVHQNWMN